MKRNKWWRMSWMLLSLLMVFSSVVPAFTVNAEEETEEVQEDTVLAEDEAVEAEETEEKEVIAWESISGEETNEDVVTEEKQGANATSVWITKADGTPVELKAGNTDYVFATGKKVSFDPVAVRLTIDEGYQSVIGLGYQFENNKYAKIYANGDFTIWLKGENIDIEAVPTAAEASAVVKESYGIYTDGNLWFPDQTVDGAGGGSITVKAASVATKKSIGIHCNDYNQYCLLEDTVVKVYTYGGDLDLAKAEAGATSIGLDICNELALGLETGFGNPEQLVLEAYGGNITKDPATTYSGFSMGITNCLGGLSDVDDREDYITGATLKAVGGAAFGQSFGIQWMGNSMDVFGSKIYAAGGSAKVESYGAYFEFYDHIWMWNFKHMSGFRPDVKTEAVFESFEEVETSYGLCIANEILNQDKFGLGNSEDSGTITIKSPRWALRGNMTAVSVFDDKNDPEGSNAKLALHDGIYADTTSKYVYATSEKYTETVDKKYYEKITNKNIEIDLKDLFDQINTTNENNLSVGNGSDVKYITNGETHTGTEASFANLYFSHVRNYLGKKFNITLKPETILDGDTVIIPITLNGTNATRTWNITIEMTAGDPVAAEVTQESITYGDTLPDPVVTINGTVNNIASGFTYKGTLFRSAAPYNSTVKPTEAGEYTVFYKQTSGDKTYYGQADFTISKRNIADAVITFDEDQYEYDGTENSVKVADVKLGEVELGPTEYKVLSGEKATDVEAKNLVIEGIGNYTGTCTSATTWSLKKATPDDTLVEFTSGKEYRYNGKPIKAEINVKDGVKGLGKLLVWYKQNNVKDNNAPTDKGTYDILLYFAEGQNYKATTTPENLGTMKIIKGYGTAEIQSMLMAKTSSVIELSDYVKNNTGDLSYEVYTGAIGTIDGSKFTAADTETEGTIKISIAESSDSNYEAGTLYLSVIVTAKDVRTLNVSMENYRVGADPKPEPVFDSPASPLSIAKVYNGVLLANGTQYNNTSVPNVAGSFSVTVSVETSDAIYVGSALFTVYDVNVFYVTFDLNGKGKNVVILADKGDTVAVPEEPKADNFVFAGWYSDADCKTPFDFGQEITTDTTIYAKWVDLCVVSFNMCGHGTAIDPQKVAPGKTATKPADPTTDDYEFGGWYTEEACTNAFDFATPITTDITLYAKWIKLYSVSFNMCGHGDPIEAQRVAEGKTVTKPADPKAEAYEFLGWCTDAACTSVYDFATPVTADLNLYAKWDIAASAMNPIPEITANTKEIYLVKGQSFTLPEGKWTSDMPKAVKITKKGTVLTAKKVTETSKPAVITLDGTDRTIKVYVSQPKYAKKKLSFTAGVNKQSLGFTYDKHLAVQWATSAPDVATVSQNGLVHAVAKGKATITAYINGKAYSCTVSVKEDTAVAERTLHLNLKKSKKISIKGVKASKAEWSVSDNSIAGVKKGKITAGEKAGTTTVTCKNTDGKIYKIIVTVEDPAIKTGQIEAAGKNKYTLTLAKAGAKAKVTFNNVVQPVVFKSSAGTKAYFDKEGNIVANGKGKATLKAKINGTTVSIKVTVSE